MPAHHMIVTMAGLGMRFRQAGYTVPKYQIVVRERTLFSWAMESLRNWFGGDVRFHFIARAEDRAGRFIEQSCHDLGVADHRLIELDTSTDGQATTAMSAFPGIEHPDLPMSIYNIDTFVEPLFLPRDVPACDGWIPCFPGKGDGWSFVKTNDRGEAVEVREKVRVSPHATIGFYWFSSVTLYEKIYNEYYSIPEHLERGERYVAPLYNHLIGQGRIVRILEIPFSGVHALGTPAEVDAFRNDLTFHQK